MTDDHSIDLSRLRDMHPELSPDLAAIMTLRAALGLQRNKHAAGVNLHMAIESSMRRVPVERMRTALLRARLGEAALGLPGAESD